jgi:hypothetical protein
MSGNINIIHYSLNAGEVSPRMAVRQDQNKYLACCLTALNARPLVVGGMTWREGTAFHVETKTVAANPLKILRPFVASRTAAYTMELGHLYVRFNNQTPVVIESSPGVPLELVTPYADTDLADVFFVQSIDVCYLLHRNYAPRKITRTAVDEFTITQVNFNPPATLEEEPTGEDLGIGTLTPGAVTGDGITFEGENGGFLAADAGRIIVFGGSRGVIATVVDTDTITVDIIDDFPDTDPIPATDWRLVLSPQTTLDVSNSRVDVGQITTLTAAVAAFRAADVGKWITIFGGLVQINTVDSSTSAKATIRSRLNDITVANPDPTAAWTLEIAAWSDELGYPSCGCFFQERFWLCKGLTINGSVTGDFENFGKGGDDDSAIARTISDDDVDSIVWIKGDKELKIGTFSGIYQAAPTTQSGALTPSSFRVDPIDPNGCARIPPLRVSPVLIYVDASLRQLRELSYNFAEDNFKSPQLFRLAEHLIDGFFINELAYSSSPDSVIYVVRNDGVLLGLVYEQVESVIAWYRIETDGLIKSICVIPRPLTGKDWLWAIVERDNGTFVEHFEPDHANTGREWHDLQTDCAIVTTHDENFVVAGLEIYERKTVWVVGDGMLFNVRKDALGRTVSTAVVVDGEITLDPQVAVDKVEIGLGYEGKIVPVSPRIDPETGTQLIAKGYVQVGINIDRALGMRLRAYRVNRSEPGDEDIVGEELAYRKPYHAMDRQVPLQVGQKCVFNLGYDFARIEILRDKPFPAEILSVIGKLHVGDMWDCDTDDVEQAFSLLPIECDEPCPVGHFASAIYNGAATIGGPAIRVQIISSEDAAFLVAALYFPSLERISIVWYDGESNEELGTILGSVSYPLEIGDVLEIKAGVRIAGVIQFSAYVNDVEVVGPVGNADIPEDASCATFFGLNGNVITAEVVTVETVPVTVNGEEITVTSL